MQKFYRNLSLLEVYHEIVNYNRELGEFLLNNDIEGFFEAIDEFIDSGLPEDPQFADALEVYRIVTPHYFIDGIPSDLIIQSLKDKGYFRDMPAAFPEIDNNTIMNLAKVSGRKRPLSAAGREAAFQELIDTYEDFIKHEPAIPATDDGAEQRANVYFDYITLMISARKKIDCSINFNKLAIKSFLPEQTLYDNIEQETTFHKRLEAIEETVSKVYKTVYTAGSKLSFKDFFAINAPYAETKEEKAKYMEQKFMLGLGHHKSIITTMSQGKFPQTAFAYISLAMFLSIPTTQRIEAFLNKFGFTLQNQYLPIAKKEVGAETYYFYGHHFQKWFDSGIDYFLIYQLLSNHWGE